MSDYQLLFLGATVLTSLLGTAGGILGWWLNRILNRHQAYLDERFDANERSRRELERTVGEVQGRVTELEQKIENAPSHTDMQRLSDRVEEVHGIVSHLNGALEGIQRTVNMVNQHLIERDK